MSARVKGGGPAFARKRQLRPSKPTICTVNPIISSVPQADVDQASNGHVDSYPQGPKSATISVTKRRVHFSGNPPLADPAISGRLCCEIPRPKRQRQQLAQCHCAAQATGIADVHRRRIISEFMQPLAAAAARRNQGRSLADDQHLADPALTGYDQRGDG